MKWIDSFDFNLTINRGSKYYNILSGKIQLPDEEPGCVNLKAKIKYKQIDDNMIKDLMEDNPEDIAICSEKNTFMIKNCSITGYSYLDGDDYVEIDFVGDEVSSKDTIIFKTKDDIELEIPYRIFHEIDHNYGNPRNMLSNEFKKYSTAILL